MPLLSLFAQMLVEFFTQAISKWINFRWMVALQIFALLPEWEKKA
jgi:hypothetical protein